MSETIQALVTIRVDTMDEGAEQLKTALRKPISDEEYGSHVYHDSNEFEITKIQLVEGEL